MPAARMVRDHLIVFRTTRAGIQVPGQYVWRWHRVAGNRKIICQGESHRFKSNAVRAALRANPDLNRADVFDGELD